MNKYSSLFSFITVVLLASSAFTATKKQIKFEDNAAKVNPMPVASTIFVTDTNFVYNAAQQYILGDSNFLSAHVGISIYNPETQQYLYNYQGDKYFVPASNMKLFTCYAAMKNLGDSLVGLRYFEDKNGGVTIKGTGDPTFLHPDFKNQSVYEFLKNKNWIICEFNLGAKHFNQYGKGWAWDDYQSDYMPERSELPIYGNVAKFYLLGDSINVIPKRFYSLPLLLFNGTLKRANHNTQNSEYNFEIVRTVSKNIFSAFPKRVKFNTQYVPFTNETEFLENHQYKSTLTELMSDTLAKNVIISNNMFDNLNQTSIIHSQPTDSLLKPMMHNSDNFFAEQTLLMVSNEKLGVMNDEKIIDTLLKTDFKGMPQKPKWVDGSGLSRYNLITPQDFVWVLTKMKNDFSWQRITTILATGNEGTLSNYYKNLSGKIFAKTGTLSNQVALSGYLITKQNKTLVFSVLVNNHQTSATNVRRAVEKFLNDIYEKY